MLLVVIHAGEAHADCCPIPALDRLKAALERVGHSIISAINTNGRALTEQMVASSQSHNRAIRDQTRALESLFKAHAAALNTMQTRRLYGQSGELRINGRKHLLTAHSPSLCDELRMAGMLHQAAVAGEKVRALMDENQRSHNEDFHSRNEVADRLHKASRRDFELAWMGRDLLDEEELSHATQSINTMVNPRPFPRLSEEQKRSPQGVSYLAKRAAHNQKYRLAQQVIGNHLLQRAPLLKQDGKRGSLLANLQDRVYATIEDNRETPWVSTLERKGVAALLRELNIGLMHLYRVQLNSLRVQQDSSVLLAVLLANDNHRLRGEVEDAWRRVLAAEGSN